jgi:hypothetical protein
MWHTWVEEKFVQSFDWKIERDLLEHLSMGVHLNHLAQDRDKWRGLVNMERNEECSPLFSILVPTTEHGYFVVS